MKNTVTSWSDGKTALAYALLGLFATPAFLVKWFGGFMFILQASLFLFGMAFFWSALWRSKGRDLWAWAAVFVGGAAVFFAVGLTGHMGD